MPDIVHRTTLLESLWNLDCKSSVYKQVLRAKEYILAENWCGDFPQKRVISRLVDVRIIHVVLWEDLPLLFTYRYRASTVASTVAMAMVELPLAGSLKLVKNAMV